MKKKPLSIKFIALAYLLAPIVNILQIAYFNHWPFHGPRSIFNHLDTYEWCMLMAFPVVAYGVWRVSRWGYVLFLSFATFLILQNTYVFLVRETYSFYVSVLFQLATFGVVGFFLQKHVAAAYFNPQIRWWETSRRYHGHRILAHIRKEQTVMKGQILDISEGGCFLDLKKDLQLNDFIWVNVSYGELNFTSKAHVMWVRKEEHPGYGLMFVNMERSESKKLDRILKELKKNLTHDVKKDDNLLTA